MCLIVTCVCRVIIIVRWCSNFDLCPFILVPRSLKMFSDPLFISTPTIYLAFESSVFLISLLTTQRLADRIKRHVPTSIMKKSSTVREQPPHMCKNISSKINCESAIGQHLITNPECAKTYTDDSFRIIGQARSSFHLDVLESVYIKTQNPVLCRQKEFCIFFKALQLNNNGE